MNNSFYPTAILTKSRLHNFKRMERRRIEFVINASYKTPLDQVKEIPEIIKNIIASIEGITLDRTHFMSYGDFSLNFETVYFVENADYNLYMDIHQSINLKIFEEFEKRKIQFAHPTQSIFITPKEKENHKEKLSKTN